MEKHADGTQKPISLNIGDQEFRYEIDPGQNTKDEFFVKLKDYQNYKIKVQYYNTEGEFIKETNHIIKKVERNAVGIMALELD